MMVSDLDMECCGRGVLFGRNGMIEYDGLWMSDKPYSPKSNDEIISNHSKCLSVQNTPVSKETSFRLSPWLRALKQIVIEDECYVNNHSFDINGLNSLESIEIGSDSFMDLISYENDEKSLPSSGIFRVVNCPNLHTICFGVSSFRGCPELVVSNLPSLQSLTMSGSNFCKGQSLSLSGA